MKPIDIIGIFTFGFFIGILSFITMVILLSGPAKNKCEKDLPRTQKCVRIWVPESVKEK